MIMRNKNVGLRLDRRLFFSYIAIILITITTSFSLFTIAANLHFRFRIEESMKEQLSVIAENIRNKPYYHPASTVMSESLLKMVQSDLILLQDGVASQYTNSEALEIVTTHPDGWNALRDTHLIVFESVKNGDIIYDIVLLTDKDMILSLNKINLIVLFITSLGSMLIATFFGVYAQNTISRPILDLNHKVNDFRHNLVPPQATIFTEDEIQDLDENLVHMAEVIINNDNNRKSFFENTSHELKTPLMSIRGYAEGLKDGIFSIDEAAEVILNESESLRTMVESILYLSKLEDAAQNQYQLHIVDINDFLTGFYYKMNGLVMERGLKLTLNLSDSVEVRIDDDKMIRALSNIITNAVRYAENIIDIRTSVEEEFINIRIFNDGPQVLEEDLQHLFQRFYKGDKGQSGLGLAIFQSIIIAHGGKVEALNVDNGFCMNIQLPYVRKEQVKK